MKQSKEVRRRPQKYNQLIFHRGAKAIQWKQDSLFKNLEELNMQKKNNPDKEFRIFDAILNGIFLS